MGIGETLKDYYYKAEDAWYKLVDKISDKLPVFGNIVDKIEEKKIPTFPLAIALVLIIIFLILFLLFGTASALSVIVKDSNGEAISGAQVTIYLSGKQIDFRETDTSGKAIFYVENNTYSIKVDKQGYVSQTKNDLTAGENNFVLSAIDSQVTKSISLKNSSGQLITGTGTVIYSCVGSSEQRYSNYENGRFNADFTDCAEIQIDSISGYTIIEGKASFSSADNIILDKVEQTTSTVTVQLNSAGNELPTELKVMLYDKEKMLVNTAYSNSNVVVFSNVIVNSYYIVVSDPSGEFNDYDGSTLGEIKELRKNEPISFNVTLTKSVSASIIITVKDVATGLPISGAEVKRKNATNQNDLDILITGNSGQVTFLVPAGSSYLITAEHPNYLIGESQTVTANQNFTFNLIEANESNSQTLLVRVKDPRGEGISSTRVVLKKTDDTIVDEKITGYNGEVEFYNLEFGSYFVFATKPGFASVTTPSTQVLPRRANTLDVVIDIGTGIIRLNVSDESGIVPGASVKAINVTGQTEKESSTDGEGKADFSIRVDKEVYFIVEAPNKASYYTSSMRAENGVLTEKNIMLKDSTGGLNVTLLGIYSDNYELDEDSETINAGKYTAKLLLEVPRGNYTEAGVHIRTGKAENNTTNLMEEDSIAIGKILASTTKTTKGKTYTPLNGYNTDSQNLTQGTAKWANVIWNNPTNALYEVEAEILVTDSLSSKVENFWYRAWTKGSSSLKNPISNIGGHELYSNAKVRLFSLNTAAGATLCSGSFCKIYSVETLTGRNAGRKQGITNNFNAQQSNTYILNADLINSKAISAAVLEIQGRGINIEEIKVNGVETSTEDIISLGGLTTDAFTKVEIKFSTNTAGSATINLKINSATKTEFDETINITIASNKKFNLDIIPKQLIPYITNTFFFTVTENETALPRTVIEIKNDSSTLGIIETNGEGLAQFELTAPRAGDKFTIIAKKEGYETITIEKEVDDRLLLITPNEINETIKIGEVTSISQTIIFTNQTVADAKIKKINVSGDLASYFNIEYANIEGTTVKSGEDSNYIITLKTNSNAQRLSQPINVTGTIKFETEIADSTQRFENSLPVNIRLSMPGYLDSASCLKVTPGSIEFITSSSEVTQNLEIENTCVAEGIKINLTELEAKLDAASNLGTVMVSGTGFTSAALSDSYTKIAQILEKDAKQSLTVRFVPSASVTSGEQNLKITFNAKNVVDTDEFETVQANTTLNLSMSNLSKCIEVTKPSTGLILEVAGWNLGYDRLVTSNLGAYANQYQGFNQRGGSSAPYGMNAMLPFTTQQNNNNNNNYEEDKFTIKNTCTVDIEIDLDPDSRISVSEETFVIGKDSDATVTVSPGYTLGKYTIGINAKLAESSDTKRKIDSVSVTVRKLGDIDTSCIKVNVTKLNFNSFIYKAERHKAFNYCYDSGVMLDRSNSAVTVQCDAPNASMTGVPYFQSGNQYNQLYAQQYPMGVPNQMGATINSYYDYLQPAGTNTTNSCAMVSGTRVVDRSVKESSSGSIEEITFEVMPSTQYIQQRKLFNSQNQTFGLFNSLADIRQWATETDARTNIYGNLNVKYTNQYGSMQTMSFPIDIADVWRLGESIDSAINWGDPNARPEQCVDEERKNSSLNIKEFWEKRGNTKGAIPEAQYVKNKTIYNHIAQPPAVRIGPASNTRFVSNTFNASQTSSDNAANCGLLDSISKINYDKEFSGVKIKVEAIGSGSLINETRGANLAVEIDRSAITQDCVYIDTVVSATLTRKINFQSGPVMWNLKAIVTRPGYTLQTNNPEIECKSGASSATLNCDAIIRAVTLQNKTKSTSEIKELVRKEEAKCVDLVNDSLIQQIKDGTDQTYTGTCENPAKEFGFDNINKIAISEITSELNTYCENNYCSTEMFSGYIFDKYYKLKEAALNKDWKSTTSGKLSELYKEAEVIEINGQNYYSNKEKNEIVKEAYIIKESYFNAGQKENITDLKTSDASAIADMIAVLNKVKTADTDNEIFLEVETTDNTVKNLGKEIGNKVYITLEKYISFNSEMAKDLAAVSISINGQTITAPTMKILAEKALLVELVRVDTLTATDTNKINLIYTFNQDLKTMRDLANKTVYLANISGKKLEVNSEFTLPTGLGTVNKFSEKITGFSQAGKYILEIDLNYKELNSNNTLPTEIKLSGRTAESKVNQNILLTNDFKFTNAKGATNTIVDTAGIYTTVPTKITVTLPSAVTSLIYKFDNYSISGEMVDWKYNNQKLVESGTGSIKTISIPTSTSTKTLTGTYFQPKDEIFVIERLNAGNGSVTVNGLIINNEIKTEQLSNTNAVTVQFTSVENMTQAKIIELVKNDNACAIENKIIWNSVKLK